MFAAPGTFPNKSRATTPSGAAEAKLMEEIELLAVVRQSNNVNTLAMINAKQERDEPVRQFVARLRGLAAVCDLTETCTCGQNVSAVDKWVRLSLIGGLNDEDTKQEVLSKVGDMTLNETITFVEAREIGKSATKSLGSKTSSTVVNQVQEKAEQKNCSYCGNKGHGRRANFETRKAKCPAHGQVCTKCQNHNHFAAVCKSGKEEKTDENKSDAKKTGASTHNVTLNRMNMTLKSGKISQVSQSTQNQMKKQQNMKKLRHEIWDEKIGRYKILYLAMIIYPCISGKSGQRGFIFPRTDYLANN